MSERNRDPKDQILDFDTTEDDEFGDYEGAEDDAPESVQAIAAPSSIINFPDLLSVQASQNKSVNKVENELESINETKTNPNIFQYQSRSSNRQSNMNISDQSCNVRGASSRETGAIPKQRALDPPDVSLLTSTSQIKLPNTLDLCTTIKPISRESNNLPSSTSIITPRKPLSLDRTSDCSQIAQLERDLKSAQTQKAVLQQQLLQKDTQIRELQSQQRQSVSTLGQESSIISLVETIEKFKNKIESSIKHLEDRINSLESKIPNLIISTIENKISSQNTNLIMTNGDEINKTTIDINMLLEQQKKEFDHERRLFLLTFSDILKKASESLQNIDLNGPNHK